MRNRKTHFEQVPIEVAATVLHEAQVQASMPQKTPAPVSALERQAKAGLLLLAKSTPSKGKL